MTPELIAAAALAAIAGGLAVAHRIVTGHWTAPHPLTPLQVAEIEAAAWRRFAIEDAEDEVTLIRWEIANYIKEKGAPPTAVRISPWRLQQIKTVPCAVVADEIGVTLDGIRLVEDLSADRNYFAE